jgi:hypothetical protein
LGAWPSRPCVGGSRSGSEPPPSCWATADTPPGNLGHVTVSRLPPPSAECTTAQFGRSGLAGRGSPPAPTGPRPRQDASPPKSSFRNRPMALPGTSRPCAVRSVQARPCHGSSQTPAPSVGRSLHNISTPSPLGKIGAPLRSSSSSPVSSLRFARRSVARGWGRWRRTSSNSSRKWRRHSIGRGIVFLGYRLKISAPCAVLPPHPWLQLPLFPPHAGHLLTLQMVLLRSGQPGRFRQGKYRGFNAR